MPGEFNESSAVHSEEPGIADVSGARLQRSGDVIDSEIFCLRGGVVLI